MENQKFSAKDSLQIISSSQNLLSHSRVIDEMEAKAMELLLNKLSKPYPEDDIVQINGNKIKFEW